MVKKAIVSILPKSRDYHTERDREGLHKHHIFGGANRSLSEKYGLFVFLTDSKHNMTMEGVHFNPKFMDELHEAGQRAFEKKYPELDFVRMFQGNYLPGKVFHHNELFGILYKGG